MNHRKKKRQHLPLLKERFERFVASDPGFTRLRLASSVAIGVASTLLVEFIFTILVHANAKGVIASMLFGAILAMMGMNALSGTDSIWVKVRIAAFFPVAIGLAMVLGVAVHGHTDLMLVVFVLVMFMAVAIRRFGIPYFFYGFMGWMGYFFTSFMGATASALPGLFSAILVATAWVLLISITVLRPNTSRSLQQTLRAFDTRALAIARACADLLNARDGRQQERLLRRLQARQVQLSETALMIEGWSAEPGALPATQSAPALRRRVIDAQQVLDQIAGCAELLVDSPVAVRQAAVEIMEFLVRRDEVAVVKSARHLTKVSNDVGLSIEEKFTVEMLVHAAVEFAELPLQTSNQNLHPTHQGNTITQPVDEFEPVVGLFMGNLPGSPAVASDVPAVGTHWNPLSRLNLPTRQAIQVAIAGGLAILAGRALSPQRYYWAVIAAFVMFTGTATRTESFIKGLNRVGGTLVGLIASVWIAELTAGHTMWVLFTVVVSIFFAFYLVRVSYAYMIFFITIMVGQLYSILHEFSTGLLVLRLKETTIGATIGFLVAVLVVPLSTRDTVRVTRNNLLQELADFLNAAADKLDNAQREEYDFHQQSLVLADRMRQLALVAKPLTRPFIWGYSPRVRHRLALYGALITGARAITVTLDGSELKYDMKVAAQFRKLATYAIGYAQSYKSGDKRTNVENGCKFKRVSAGANRDEMWDIGIAFNDGPIVDPLIRRLLHLQRLLYDLSNDWSDIL